MKVNDYYSSVLGLIRLEADENALTGLWFEDDAELSEKSAEDADLPDNAVIHETVKWLDIYFSGKEPDFMPNVRPEGSDFRKKIWDLLLEIPYGETVSYKDIRDRYLEKYGVSRMAAQAVGNAIGHNPVSLIIPCHRVIGSDGSLTGYGGGLDRKAYLLKLEKGTKTEE